MSDIAQNDRLKILVRKACYHSADGTKAARACVLKGLSDDQLVLLWISLVRMKRDKKEVDYGALVYLIQNDWGEMTSLSKANLTKAIRTFESRAFGLLGQARNIKELEGFADEKEELAKRITKKVDALGYWSKAITRQWERIEKIWETESASFPLATTHKEFRVFNEMLDRYMHYQLELGLVKRQPHAFDLNFRMGFDGMLGKIDQTTGRDRIIEAGHKLIELVKSGKGDHFETEEG